MTDPTPLSRLILAVLQTRNLYAGTVPDHVKATRRAQNRRARISRRINRRTRNGQHL